MPQMEALRHLGTQLEEALESFWWGKVDCVNCRSREFHQRMSKGMTWKRNWGTKSSVQSQSNMTNSMLTYCLAYSLKCLALRHGGACNISMHSICQQAKPLTPCAGQARKNSLVCLRLGKEIGKNKLGAEAARQDTNRKLDEVSNLYYSEINFNFLSF